MKRPAAIVDGIGAPPKKTKAGPKLWYCSDCSGMDIAALALKRSKAPFRHWFASENSGPERQALKAIHPEIEHIFEDCNGRNLNKLKAERLANPEKKLVYTSGFPCQPYSRSGLHLGERDARSKTVWSVLGTIKVLLPDIFMLENVADLCEAARYKKIFEDIMKIVLCMENSAYQVHYRVMDSYEYGGVPASRRRMYIIGVLKTSLRRAWKWPQPVKPPSLASILEERNPHDKADLNSLSVTALRNIAAGIKKIKENNGKVTDPWVIDCGNSESFGVSVTYNRFPTLTRSHANCLWITSVKDFATATELLAAQGIRKGDLKLPKDAKVSDYKLGQMLGNSFTLTIFLKLFKEVLPAIGVEI